MNVIDFFCGCGGTSLGFQQAGMRVSVGIDVDPDSSATFAMNFPAARTLNIDVRTLTFGTLRSVLPPRPWLFSGCAPCQPFSRQNGKKSVRDSRRTLLDRFGLFVEEFRPEYVFVENVPGLQRIGRGGPLGRFKRLLDSAGYSSASDIVSASSFGVPQKRERFMLLASKRGPISLPRPTHGEFGHALSTVRDWISDLPPIAAGETNSVDPVHRASALTPINLQRIRATREGGGREDWPKKLILKCHRNHGGHSDVYGRLAWDRPASGLTTRCVSLSNGRFGHPDQDRAISAREAARLQTFPMSYKFSGKFLAIATQIGNAVPPLMAEQVGRQILGHIESE